MLRLPWSGLGIKSDAVRSPEPWPGLPLSGAGAVPAAVYVLRAAEIGAVGSTCFLVVALFIYGKVALFIWPFLGCLGCLVSGVHTLLSLAMLHHAVYLRARVSQTHDAFMQMQRSAKRFQCTIQRSRM